MSDIVKSAATTLQIGVVKTATDTSAVNVGAIRAVVTYTAADSIAPTVTINQADGQLDPTTASPVNFIVVFSEPVADFATGDISFTGSTAEGALVGTVTGSGTTYNVAVSGMTSFGTIVPSIAAGAANDAAGNDNEASTSTDNSVFFDVAAPECAIDTAENMLTNPCLELMQADEPAFWSKSANGDTATFSYPAPGEGGAGSKGAKVAVTTHTPGGDAKWFFDEIAVEGNTDYVYSAKYKSDVPTRLVVAQFDGATGDYTTSLEGVVPSPSEWGTVAIEFHTNPGTDTLTVFHLVDSVGELTIDSASLMEVEPIEVTDMVPNNSVEEVSPVNPELPRGWTTAGYETVGSDITPTFDYVEDDGHEGDRSVKVTVTGFDQGEDADAKWMYVPQPIAIEDDEEYRFTAWYKTDTTPHVVAQFTVDGNTKFLGLPNPMPETDPSEGGWSKYETEFSAPEGATDVTVFFFLKSNGFVQTDDYSIDNTYAYDEFSRALVTLTFDDGFEGNVSNVLPVLEGHDLPSTQCFKTDTVGLSAGVLAFFTAGHEVCAHTNSHPDLTTLSNAAMESELDVSKSMLETIVGAGNVTSFATPFGAYNASVNTEIMERFALHRTVDEGYNSKDALDPSRIRVQNMKPTTTLAEFQGWVEKAAEDKTWLVLVYHRVLTETDLETTTVDPFDTYKADFDAQMAWLNAEADAGHVAVKTLKDAYAETQDTTAPTAEVSYDVTVATTGSVVATLVNPSEPITVTNNDGLLTKTFTENGSFVFEFKDAAGNAGSATATVSNIDLTAPVIAELPDVTIPATDATGATYAYALPSVTDADGSIVPSCVPAPGSLFAMGPATTVTCDATDNVGHAAAPMTFDVTVTDQSAPVISVDPAVVTAHVGDVYVDAGVTATDNVDGDVTAQIVVGGDAVVTTAPATFVLTYDVSDAAGNAATQQTRTVNVTDGSEPVITLVGGTVTINTGDAFVEPGYSALDNVDGDLTANVIVSGSVNTEVPGTYTLTYTVVDSNSNTGTANRSVIVNDDDSATIDIAYDITVVTHGPVTATASASEAGSFTNEGGNTHLFTENGEFTFTFQDEAGNVSSAVAVVTNINAAAVFPTCPEGFDLVEGDCAATGGPIPAECPAGTTLDGETCVADDQVGVPPTECVDGFHIVEGMCVADNVAPTCADGLTLIEGQCVPPTEAPTCATGSLVNDECVEDPVAPTEGVCPDGFVLEGESCVDSAPEAPTCDAGFTYSADADACVSDEAPTAPTECPAGFTLAGDTCVADDQAGVPPTECSEGFSLNGSDMCVADSTVPNVCPSGYALDGTSCVPQNVAPSCPSGMHVNDEGDLCVSDPAPAPAPATSGGGGGGSGGGSTASYEVEIEGGAARTEVREVTLTLKRANSRATQVMIANDDSFAGATWRAYASRIDWTLPGENGRKRVYVRFGDEDGDVLRTASDTIRLEVEETDEPAPAETEAGGEVLGAATYQFTRHLTVGMSGEDVTELQKILIAEGFLSVPAPTGYFGPLTAEAVKKYQAAHGIFPNSGYVGDLTIAELNKGTAPVATMTEDEMKAKVAELLKLIAELQAKIAANLSVQQGG